MYIAKANGGPFERQQASFTFEFVLFQPVYYIIHTLTPRKLNRTKKLHKRA